MNVGVKFAKFLRTQYVSLYLCLLGTVVASVGTQKCFAIWDLQVREDLDVYEKPSKNSRILSQLTHGDKVVVSPKAYGEFRKVLITYGGKRRAGYIESAEINESQIIERGDRELEGSRVYTTRYSLGISAVLSYLQQSSRNFTTSSQDTYAISELKSSSLYFSIFTDIPWRRNLVLRPFLSFRSAAFNGTAQLKGGLTNYRTADVDMIQKFFGLGLLTKFYSHALSSFWYGGSLEVIEKTSSKIVIDDGIPLSVEDNDKSILALIAAALGWDIALPQSLWLIPDIRLGVIINSDPKIYFGEATLSLAYSF